MIVTLIVAAEIGFWVLLVAGLALRYFARLPRVGAAVLLAEPLLEVVLLVVTAIDLRGGAEPDWKHGLAAVYIGMTVTHGHYLVKWADGHFAHRFAGGPPPVRPPRYGRARAVHEWKMAARGVGGAAIAMALLELAVRYVGDPGQVAPLHAWQQRMLGFAGICVLIAVVYTVWPKRAPAGAGRGGKGGEAAPDPSSPAAAAHEPGPGPVASPCRAVPDGRSGGESAPERARGRAGEGAPGPAGSGRAAGPPGA